jgi:predicted metal-binding protein
MKAKRAEKRRQARKNNKTWKKMLEKEKEIKEEGESSAQATNKDPYEWISDDDEIVEIPVPQSVL